MDIFNNSPKLQDIISARLNQFKKEKKSPYRYHDEDGYFTIYLPGIKKRSFEIKDNLPYQGDWALFVEWLGDTEINLDEARKQFKSNTTKCEQYKNNKLMHTDCRALVDTLRSKLMTPVGKPAPDTDKEFQYAQSLIDKYGIDKARAIVSYVGNDKTTDGKDGYWRKAFFSLGWFFRPVKDSNIFEVIAKSINK